MWVNKKYTFYIWAMVMTYLKGLWESGTVNPLVLVQTGWTLGECLQKNYHDYSHHTVL